MEKEFAKRFDECPACGSKERFFEMLANELKLKGHVQPDFNFRLDMKQGIVASPELLNRLPIGSELLGFQFATDICARCGMIYAVELKRVKAAKQVKVVVPSLQLPANLRGN